MTRRELLPGATDCAWSATADAVYIGFRDGNVRLYTVPNLDLFAVYRPRRQVLELVSSRDGYISTMGWDGDIAIYREPDMKLIADAGHDPERYISSSLHLAVSNGFVLLGWEFEPNGPDECDGSLNFRIKLRFISEGSTSYVADSVLASANR